jgi:hypothetical protein
MAKRATLTIMRHKVRWSIAIGLSSHALAEEILLLIEEIENI